jgi:hypothetical protein
MIEAFPALAVEVHLDLRGLSGPDFPEVVSLGELLVDQPVGILDESYPEW